MKILNLAGLVLNLIGTILVWRFGLPPSVDRKGRTFLITHAIDEAEVEQARNMDRCSHLGAALIVAGFFLQAIAAW